MNILGIIPSRYASTRLPGKPLVYIKGKTMIQRVYENASKSKSLNRVVVATDDQRIFDHVQDFGGNVLMTSPNHKSGTDRCCEVIKNSNNQYDVVVNIQGDEPFINPDQIDLLSKSFDKNEVQIATLIKQIKNHEELFNENIPKVIINTTHEALYFSRQPIPYYRGCVEQKWDKLHNYYKHIGIYAFRVDMLKKIENMQPSPLETAESLEQLRWLENGIKIHVAITRHDSFSVDTPDDLLKLNLLLT